MAISHIPRSVGHNFLPEYQISSIPYCFKLADDCPGMELIVVHKSTGTIAATPDPDNAGEYLVVAGSGFTANDLKTQNANPINSGNLPNTFDIIHRLKLPKIAQWMQVKNLGGDNIYKVQGGTSGGNDNVSNPGDVLFYFHPKAAVNTSTNGQFRVHSHEITDIFNFRFSALYFAENQLGTNVNIRIGLTTIDANQFDDVLETFLNYEL